MPRITAARGQGAQEEIMTAGSCAVTAGSSDRLQAAVNDAAKRLYDAEAALHIARQTGVGSWISAAYDRLHEAVVGHTAAVGALQRVSPGDCGRPNPRH